MTSPSQSVTQQGDLGVEHMEWEQEKRRSPLVMAGTS